MTFLVHCECGHTLEHHLEGESGCNSCPCTRSRTGALDALIAAMRFEGDPATRRRNGTRTTPSGTVLRGVD